MDSFFDGVWNRVKNSLFREPVTNRGISISKAIIGCLVVLGTFVSYMLIASYADVAVVFLGLMILFGGAADVVYADTDNARKRAALLRAVSILCAILFLAFFAVYLFSKVDIAPI